MATWTGQKAVYDLMGRVVSQTVPTEIDGNWNPTGTDQNWRSTSQEYDWKGRITREIGLDNIDRVYAYDGCGCAGGQVTTGQGELIDGKRRTQRVYADILGRTWKTEVLDDNNQVYTSSVTKYNGRDQQVWTKQFAGAAPGDALNSDSCPVPQANEPQTCQIAVSEYDGHGRISKNHASQQDANKFISYTYNAADQPETVTDARGATSTYIYNNRGLMTSVGYAMPTTNPTPSSSDRLLTNELLHAGESITSPNGLYKLIYQTDGNLVLYDEPTGTPLWAAQVSSRGAEKSGSSLLLILPANSILPAFLPHYLCKQGLPCFRYRNFLQPVIDSHAH